MSTLEDLMSMPIVTSEQVLRFRSAAIEAIKERDERIGNIKDLACEFSELLCEAKDLFRMYEKLHIERGQEHLEKAERNGAIASKIERSLLKLFF